MYIDEMTRQMIKLSAKKGTGEYAIKFNPDDIIQHELELIADHCISCQEDMYEFDDHADMIMSIFRLVRRYPEGCHV